MHMSQAASNRFDSIVCLDITLPDPVDYPKNVRFIQADVRNKAALVKAAKDCDVIIHAAAALPLESKKTIFDTNLLGTKNTLEAALENRVRRFIQISSTAVYGVPEKFPIEESDPLIPVGPYAETKIQSEQMCVDYRNKGLITTIIRPKTFIGTYRLGVFQILYDWVYCGAKIPMIGNGNNRYQLLEVTDLTSAIQEFFDAPEVVANDVYNVGSTQFGTVREDLSALCSHAGGKSRPFSTPAGPTIVALTVLEKLKLSPLYKWVYGTACKNSMVSVEKLLKQTNWKPKFSNSDALIHAYDWYLANLESLTKVSGTTHRAPWKQGALSLVKHCLK